MSNRAQELRARVVQQREEIAALKEYFASLFSAEYMVSDSQFGIWIRQYGFEYAVLGFEEAAKKMNKINQQLEEGVFDNEGNQVQPMDKLGLIKFASWVMSHEKKLEERGA